MLWVLDTRKEGKWDAYRDGSVIIIEKRARRMALKGNKVHFDNDLCQFR